MTPHILVFGIKCEHLHPTYGYNTRARSDVWEHVCVSRVSHTLLARTLFTHRWVCAGLLLSVSDFTHAFFPCGFVLALYLAHTVSPIRLFYFLLFDTILSSFFPSPTKRNLFGRPIRTAGIEIVLLPSSLDFWLSTSLSLRIWICKRASCVYFIAFLQFDYQKRKEKNK